MIKKIKEVILFTCSLLGIQVIFSDLGLPHYDMTIWGKYVFAVGFGLLMVFYIKPQAEKNKTKSTNR